MMKSTIFSLLLLLPIGAMAQRTELKLFDNVTFYDGYLFEKNPDSLLQDGVLRHSTSLYAVKMTSEQLALIGDSLRMEVYVRACCDNYDRIGNINMAFVPKGRERYSTDSVQRIELGRFITPFMDKNKEPSVVPYSFDIDYVSYILRDANILAENDIWIEYELFGVPYAANQQINGCAGRSDVFKGTLVFATTQPALPQTEHNVLVPIVMKKNESQGHNLNNYSEAGTDTIGKTTKTYTFDVPCNTTDAQLVVVTSNHGSNSGGEEYNRRWHYIYVDDELMLSYLPGRESCEPFRKYNTQSNGIYGPVWRSNKTWQSFSNWCPGDIIDNRIISLGSFNAGSHRVRISVPDAQFKDKQGDIPVSIFFQGLTEGQFDAVNDATIMPTDINVKMMQGELSIETRMPILNIDVYDLQGKHLSHSSGHHQLSLKQLPQGIYLVNVELEAGIIETHKVKKQ